MKQPRAKYSQQFKEHVLELEKSSNMTQKELGQKLGVPDKTIRRWRQAAERKDGVRSDPLSESERKELRKLRRLTSDQAKIIEVLREYNSFLDQPPQQNT